MGWIDLASALDHQENLETRHIIRASGNTGSCHDKSFLEDGRGHSHDSAVNTFASSLATTRKSLAQGSKSKEGGFKLVMLKLQRVELYTI
jgi:hypothetical protein